MRLSRMFTDQPLEPGQTINLDAKTGHYVFRVLKLRAGDPLVLFNGDGADYACELASNRRDQVEARVRARVPAVAESPLHITLVQAVGKGDRMDLALQKATELGVSAVQPLFSQRTEVRLEGSRLEKRQQHWARVMISACEQSGRAVVPTLASPQTLEHWLAGEQRPKTLALVPGAETSLAAAPLPESACAVMVGPEGGWSETELKLMQLARVQPVGLGPRVLRTETAGPAAITVLQVLAGDLGR